MEGDTAVVRTANDRLVERVVKTERQCWEKAQYSQEHILEIIGIPNYIGNSILEETVSRVFKKIGVEYNERDAQVCHRLKEKERTIIKFVNRKDCLQTLRTKKELKSPNPTELDFPENTKIFISGILCHYYKGIWSKCKKLRTIQKIHQFYTISGLTRVKLEETGPSKIITHMADLKDLFPDIDFEKL